MKQEETVEIDLAGNVVLVPRGLVGALAAAAAARAGISGRHRDLSLLLNRARESGRATLNRGEARTLGVVLEEQPDRFGPGAAELLLALPQ
ncbi:MAG TPA: hypothetical protein VGH46_11845 [Gaiellaceae bacterium]|jgi:hypothetical protein